MKILESSTSRKENLEYLNLAIQDHLENERDLIANLSNISAMIKFFIDDINWCGFYLFKDGELVLGPFQGKVACVRIPLGKGVCGKAAKDRQTQLVDNVHQFPGHIACDSASNSEIVVPIIIDGQLFGVLDIDSPTIGRFTSLEKLYLEEIVNNIKKLL